MVIDWPEKNQDNPAGKVWTDVTRHCSSWRSYYFSQDSVTTCHECTHGVNADIRNAHTEKKYNGFYLLEGKALLMEEPNFLKSQVNQFVPVNLRGNRYKTYLEGMRDWQDRPFYLIDEFTAYTNGAFQASKNEIKMGDNFSVAITKPFPRSRREYSKGYIEEFKSYGIIYKIVSSVDWAMAPLEFLVYFLAVMIACEKFSPSTLDTLREDFVILWKRGWESYRAALKVFPWPSAEQYEKDFNQCAELQNFVEKLSLNDEQKPDFSSI